MDELTAAGITDPDLRASYEECKRLNALHGKTYYLATLLLPKAKRPFVHALYGFARYADEIVDDLASELSVEEKAEVLSKWGNGVLADLKKGISQDHVGRALIDTVKRFDIPHEHFEAFLHSMTMDLTVQEYESYEDLLEYVYGSAAVIGLEMVPILGPLHNDAFEAAKKLGIAFQLANFIRDVDEDLDRGRVYLPLKELGQFGVTREMLEERVLDLPMREADVAIRMKEPSQADLIRKRLMGVRMRLYASPDYLAKHGTPERIEDVAQHRLICQNPTAHQVGAGAMLVAHLMSYEPRSTLKVNNYFGVLQGVLSNLGVGVLPDYLTQDFPNLSRVMPEVESAEVPVFLAYPEELRHSKRVSAFRDFVQEEIISYRKQLKDQAVS